MVVEASDNNSKQVCKSNINRIVKKCQNNVKVKSKLVQNMENLTKV